MPQIVPASTCPSTPGLASCAAHRGLSSFLLLLGTDAPPPPLQRSGWAHCGCSHTGAQSCTEDRRETLWAALRSRRCGLPFLLSQLQYLGFPAPTWNLWGKGRRLVGSAWHLWWTPRASSSCLLLCYWVSTQNIWVILLKRISQQCTTSTAAVRGFWSSFGCESLCGSGWSRSGL